MYDSAPAPVGADRSGGQVICADTVIGNGLLLTRGVTLAKYTVTPSRASDTRYERVKCWRARASISPTLYRRMPPSLDAGATLPLCCHLRTVASLT